jgi:hypothetical protein
MAVYIYITIIDDAGDAATSKQYFSSESPLVDLWVIYLCSIQMLLSLLNPPVM